MKFNFEDQQQSGRDEPLGQNVVRQLILERHIHEKEKEQEFNYLETIELYTEEIELILNEIVSYTIKVLDQAFFSPKKLKKYVSKLDILKNSLNDDFVLLEKERREPDVDREYAVNCKLEQYIISLLVIYIKEIMTNIEKEMSHGKVILSREMRNIVGDYKEKLYAIANEMSMLDPLYRHKVQSEEKQKSKGKDSLSELN